MFVTEPPTRWSSSLKGFKAVTSQAPFFNSNQTWCFLCCFSIMHCSFCQIPLDYKRCHWPSEKRVTCPARNSAFTPGPLGQADRKWTTGWLWMWCYGYITVNYGYHAKRLLRMVKMKKKKQICLSDVNWIQTYSNKTFTNLAIALFSVFHLKFLKIPLDSTINCCYYCCNRDEIYNKQLQQRPTEIWQHSEGFNNLTILLKCRLVFKSALCDKCNTSFVTLSKLES